jgi:hypothetical protein
MGAENSGAAVFEIEPATGTMESAVGIAELDCFSLAHAHARTAIIEYRSFIVIDVCPY